MKDKVKKALKRAASGLLAVLLAVCLVGTPRAKAVVSEGALLGSLFGSLLVSMGYSWAADNMDVPGFGESIYNLTQEFDEAMKDTGNQLIRDLTLAGVVANGAGKLQFGYAWVQAARSFAEWLSDKYAFSGNESAVVYDSSNQTLLLSNGDSYSLSIVDLDTSNQKFMTSLGKLDELTNPIVFQSGHVLRLDTSGEKPIIRLEDSQGTLWQGYTCSGYNPIYHTLLGYGIYSLCVNGSYYVGLFYSYRNNESGNIFYSYGGDKTATSFYQANSFAVNNTVLTLSAPNGLDVSDIETITPSQAYELTFEGVTATDIDGIIQGAVDRILAGTAAIAGEVTQAGTGEIVENPEIDPYKVGLSSVFPFCIPFDVYNMVTMFVAEPEAPSAEWSFTLPWSNQEYSVGWDLAAFDGVARVCRDMELVLFAVGLAVITYKVIKW